ncbi:hypothetical protein N825_27430 [Skermanella stibiiresistens SB22]|uniref:Uncharacterized protein n=1 Tax=Skermanella stibiiresistens SB22 TaxID=1385369 RepID=W9H4Y2_9PROT|nr:hypothetical protein N825_27430 [Skermanella stibiiresistens SB22]
MRNALLGVAILAGAGISAGYPQGSPASAQAAPAHQDVTAVGETFVAARQALLAKDGGGVIELLSRDSLDRVERTRKAALDGEMTGLGPSEKFGALGLRQYLKPAELRRMTPAQIVEFGLQKNWLGPNVITQAGMERISVRGDRASGTLVVNQRPVMVPADFVREDGVWRVDLTRAMDLTDALVRGTAMATKRSEDAVIKDILDRAIRNQAPTR